MATNTFGAFQFTLNSDNSTSVPAGMYFVAADAQINAPAEDDWQIPPQMTFSVCVGYSYPGVYQQSVRRFPDVSLGTLKKGGTLGSLVIAGSVSIATGDHVWAGLPRLSARTRKRRSRLKGACRSPRSRERIEKGNTMLWKTLATVSLWLLSACTVIKVEGNANSIADSGNHNGRLTWPGMTAPDASGVITRPPEE